jgi:hypothetical protein
MGGDSTKAQHWLDRAASAIAQAALVDGAEAKRSLFEIAALYQRRAHDAAAAQFNRLHPVDDDKDRD